MSAPISFDNTGMPYDPSAIIQDGTFSQELYEAYSPIFLPITFALEYAIAFASTTAVIVHTYCKLSLSLSEYTFTEPRIVWYRRDIMLQMRRSLKENKDIHSRLMAVYPEVPHMWYGALGLIAFALAIVTVTVFDTKLPVWALIIALIFAMVFVIPIGMIRAITNQMVALQILAELIVGYMLPGRPVAMMIFKTFSFIAMSQALSFLSDLKLGHYMKIPPRMMFLAQVIATIVSVFVVVGVQSWMFSNIPDLCQPDQPHSFTCPSTSVFATAAMVWGGVGPRRLFSSGALYNPLMYFFLIGAFLPLPFYYLARRYPLSFWRYVNVPVMMAGVAILPPATGINFSSWFTFGAFFQYFMRRFHYRVSTIFTQYFLDCGS